MFDETKNQASESQEAQNPAPPQNPEKFEERMKKLNGNGKKSGKRKKIYSIIGIVLLLIFLGGATAGSYYFWDDITNFFSNDVVCVGEIIECPDGSFVERIPPTCELAECPVVEIKKECAEEGELINYPSGTNKNLPDICCERLKGLAEFGINENDECEQLTGGPFLTCMPCGNGVCDTINNFNENKCNCPEDCKNELSKISIMDDWETYWNEEFGFSVIFNKEYKNIWESKTHRFETDIDSRSLARIDFYFKDYPLHVFSWINIYKKEWFIENSEKRIQYKEWSAENNGTIEEYNENKDKMKSEFIREKGEIAWLNRDKDGYPLGTYIGENNNYVFILGIGPNACSATKLLCSLPAMKTVMNSFQIIDSDNDGLFNNEETRYGCDINNPDTDGDGFLDGDEVKNGYNPAGEGEL